MSERPNPEPLEGGPPHERGGWAGNLRLRVLSGIPALALVLALVGLAPSWLIALIVMATGIYAMYEFREMLPEPHQSALRREVALVGALVVGLGGVLAGSVGLQLGLFLAVVGVTIAVWLPAHNGDHGGLDAAGLAAFGFVVFPWTIFHLALIHSLPGGGGMLALLIVVITVNDSVAYLVGSLFGSRRLWPRVSPNKTVEGSLAGLMAGTAAALAVWVWLLGFAVGPSFFEAILLGLALSAVAQCGDLFESKLKRLVGADDSGSLLPGHGGLLDRIDAYVLCGPVLYYYLALTAAPA